MLLGVTNHMEKRMKDIDTALTKLIKGFEGFTDELRNMVNGHDQEAAADLGGYEENYEPDADAGFAEENDDAPQMREDIDDDTMVTLRSGDLRKVIDSYRKLVRYARNGKIPTQEERFKLHQSIKRVKHLIRKPV
jgi:hypothetical protein